MSAHAEDPLDATDVDLTLDEKQSRMRVCMEIVKTYTRENQREVKLYVQQLSDRLDEHDSKNYLYHSLLVNCYHAIEQEEVFDFGNSNITAARFREILTRPADKPKLRLSANQLEVLNGILRASGASREEPEKPLLGFHFADLPEEARWALILLAVCLFLLVAGSAVSFFSRRSANSSKKPAPRIQARKPQPEKDAGALPAAPERQKDAKGLRQRR
eukprot:TRINITY_DN121823_c0_g1_i1.p1 TRINITY_DN121823_c0_g1~~TRINITY_DN121823_c0_g1_i1.p1  ORF type:complete len:216 (+),score=55.10 TRINITY_DN121823_c0_g1_i1:205-852(+)